MLKMFDLNSVPNTVLPKLKKLTYNPAFKVENVKKASMAAASMCRWVLAVQENLINKKSPGTPKNNQTPAKSQGQRNEHSKEQMRIPDENTHVFVVETCENCHLH